MSLKIEYQFKKHKRKVKVVDIPSSADSKRIFADLSDQDLREEKFTHPTCFPSTPPAKQARTVPPSPKPYRKLFMELLHRMKDNRTAEIRSFLNAFCEQELEMTGFELTPTHLLGEGLQENRQKAKDIARLGKHLSEKGSQPVSSNTTSTDSAVTLQSWLDLSTEQLWRLR